MKDKVVKTIKMTVVYKEYKSGMKSIEYKRENKEIIRWIGRDYLNSLLEKDRL